jgi:hypothetical protein
MTGYNQNTPCIEIEFLTGTRKAFSVAEYEADLSKARRLSGPRARSFHEVAWAEDAPPVEALTVEWQEPGCEKFRISDREAYDLQVRRLLGII